MPIDRRPLHVQEHDQMKGYLGQAVTLMRQMYPSPASQQDLANILHDLWYTLESELNNAREIAKALAAESAPNPDAEQFGDPEQGPDEPGPLQETPKRD